MYCAWRITYQDAEHAARAAYYLWMANAWELDLAKKILEREGLMTEFHRATGDPDYFPEQL